MFVQFLNFNVIKSRFVIVVKIMILGKISRAILFHEMLCSNYLLVFSVEVEYLLNN